MRIALCVRVAEANGCKVAARVQCVVDRNVIGMSLAVKEWTVEEMKCGANLYSSIATDKAVAEVVSQGALLWVASFSAGLEGDPASRRF